MQPNITFRTNLVGALHDFCLDTNLSLINQPINLVELIVILSRYQEEGVDLCPQVYLTSNLCNLLSMLPESDYFEIGSSLFSSDLIKDVIKRCAPLAISGWWIYIEENHDKVNYGLFRATSNPISVSADDVILSDNDDLIVVKLFKIARECVEIRANNGTSKYVFLNHFKEDCPPPLLHLNELVQRITSKAGNKIKEQVTIFLNKLLFESLRHSHGCLIAVTNMNKVPRLLSNDGIMFAQPIDFIRLVSEAKNSWIDTSNLNCKGYLVQGMLNSDGIILFDDRARLLGYNIFVKINPINREVGGSRKRAFSALSKKIGKGLCAVYMQSQDGLTNYTG